jgi:8-oxo-dGTP pyrophosphatase MutT (NUDIX family)
MSDHLARLRAALSPETPPHPLRHRARRRPHGLPGVARQGAVLCLLYPWQDGLHLLLTGRPDGLRHHSGQISFPGGRIDPDETALEAALRETAEEVGVAAETITVVGALTPLYIPPSDFEVFPFVGYAGQRPDFRPNSAEVAFLLEPALHELLHPACCHYEERHFPHWPHPVRVPWFSVQGQRVWGATALMLSDFLERWQPGTLSAGHANSPNP